MTTDLRKLLREARAYIVDVREGKDYHNQRIVDRIDAALAEKAPEPFCYALTLNGVLCDGDNVVSTDANQLQVDSMQDYAADGEKYEAMPLYAVPPTANPADARVDWSWIRSVLAQGASIQQDYQAGKYPTYEHYAARLDEAARERMAAIETSPENSMDTAIKHALAASALKVVTDRVEKMVETGRSDVRDAARYRKLRYVGAYISDRLLFRDALDEVVDGFIDAAIEREGGA